MMEPGVFPNLYWSADYKSGIDSLTEQTLKSLKQLHEVRKLVFSYMNYHHSNGEFLTRLAIDSYSLESSFRKNSDPKEGHLLSPKSRNSMLKRLSSSLSASSTATPPRSASQTDYQFRNIQSIASSPSTPRSGSSYPGNPSRDPADLTHTENSDLNMKYAYELHIKGATDEAQIAMDLASAIDKEILEPLTAFLKSNEPRVKSFLVGLNNNFQDYKETYSEVEKLKLQYTENFRLNEIAKSDPNKTILEDDESSDSEDQLPPQEDSVDKIDLEQEDAPDTSAISTAPDAESALEAEFDFPLSVGGALEIENATDLTKLLKKMIDSISTIKRKIPIPGYKNQIFSSDQLCEWLIRYRPFGMDPSRRNMEKFGQGLIDLKFLVGTGLFARKFNSENMWFEWSELAQFVAEYDSTQEKPAPKTQNSSPRNIVSPSQRMSKKLLDEQASKFVNDTSKRFNGMFRSVRTSLLKNDYSAQLLDIEDQYNQSYLELQELKHVLETEIQSKSRDLETFERTRISVIYQSLSKLSEILYNNSLNTTTHLHKIACEQLKDVNVPENHDKDFNELLESYSTGIYFPTIIDPDILTKKHYSTNQSNNNFQNIKFQFNLYKDISLQPLQSEGKKDVLSISSIPQILFQSINLIKENGPSKEALSIYWMGPTNHQAYWVLKEELVEIVSSFIPRDEALEYGKEHILHKDIMTEVTNLFKDKHVSDVINFMKNWLLEIGDSLIPCMIYDSLVNNYNADLTTESLDIEVRRKETIRLLTSIPRSNLSSLIFILEHISEVFELDLLPDYGESDNLPEGLVIEKIEPLESAVTKLSSVQQIGSVPFIHLILRPSAIKNSAGFKPPLHKYRMILSDLLNVEVRAKLFGNLVNNEKNYLSKKQNERFNLGLQKKTLVSQQHQATPKQTSQHLDTIPQTPKQDIADQNGKVIISNIAPKSPRPLSGENFALRPFRTGTTPRPSPSSSPRHTPVSSMDQTNSFSGNEIKVKKSRDTSTPTTRNRSSSSAFLTPNIDIQFEK